MVRACFCSVTSSHLRSSSTGGTITITHHTCTLGCLQAQREQIDDQLKVLHRSPLSRGNCCWNDSYRYHRLQPRYPGKGLIEESTMTTFCLSNYEASRLARLIESPHLVHPLSRNTGDLQSLCTDTVLTTSLLAVLRSRCTPYMICARFSNSSDF
jgi:hypothetical protein